MDRLARAHPRAQPDGRGSGAVADRVGRRDGRRRAGARAHRRQEGRRRGGAQARDPPGGRACQRTAQAARHQPSSGAGGGARLPKRGQVGAHQPAGRAAKGQEREPAGRDARLQLGADRLAGAAARLAWHHPGEAGVAARRVPPRHVRRHRRRGLRPAGGRECAPRGARPRRGGEACVRAARQAARAVGRADRRMLVRRGVRGSAGGGALHGRRAARSDDAAQGLPLGQPRPALPRVACRGAGRGAVTHGAASFSSDRICIQ
mmetsp:Transcript_27651/g.86768  ORF Transcript_27651/g.86768 Transcript_27651/m.86768 type:complete len:262 (-) Transcript_27651:8-793(-)